MKSFRAIMRTTPSGCRYWVLQKKVIGLFWVSLGRCYVDIIWMEYSKKKAKRALRQLNSNNNQKILY